MEVSGTVFTYSKCSRNALGEVMVIIDSTLCSGFLTNLNGQFKGLKSGI